MNSHKRIWRSILLCSVFLFSCSQILFEHAMPASGRVIQKLPSSFSGEYLSFNFDSSSITGTMTKIKVTDKPFPSVAQFDLLFMDSATWYGKHSFGIDTVWFENNKLLVKSGSKKLQLSLKDTLSSSKDTSDSFFPRSVKNNESVSFEIRKYRDACYLNTLDTLNHYVTVKLWFDDDDLLINPFYLFDNTEKSSSGDSVATMIERYNLSKIIKDSSSWSQDYLANITDDQFWALEKEFELRKPYVRLYRLNKNSGQWLIGLLVFGVIFLVLLIEFSKHELV